MLEYWNTLLWDKTYIVEKLSATMFLDMVFLYFASFYIF